MMTAETMRSNAENCRALAEGLTSEPVRTQYLRMAAAWEDLAKSQDWLDGRLRSSPALQPLGTAAELLNRASSALEGGCDRSRSIRRAFS